MARERDVDLVEVSANASPPVARLMDFGQYKYIWIAFSPTKGNSGEYYAYDVEGVDLDALPEDTGDDAGTDTAESDDVTEPAEGDSVGGCGCASVSARQTLGALGFVALFAGVARRRRPDAL